MNRQSQPWNHPSESNSPVALVVGASGGIGSAVVTLLLSKGWSVIAATRRPEKLRSMLLPLEYPREQLSIFSLDSTSSLSVNSCLDSIMTQFGHLDGVVHSVGSILLKPAHLISDEEFEEALLLNLKTAFYLLRSSTRLMMKQPSGGSILFCSSVAAERGLINHEGISAAKAGLQGMALAAAATYAPYKIRVNCVAPGLTRTELTEKLTSNESILKKSEAMHPLGRIGEPIDIASAIAWFLDPMQSWVTGQVLGIDGGLGKLQSR